MKELGEKLNSPVGKSGVNHRLRKAESDSSGYSGKRVFVIFFSICFSKSENTKIKFIYSKTGG